MNKPKLTAHERIVQILQDDMDLREECITPDSRFDNDLGLDSFDMTEFIAMVEEEFGIVIEDVDARNLCTVGDLAKWVEEHPGDES